MSSKIEAIELTSPGRRFTPLILLALICALVGVVLPARATAELLARDAALLPEIIAGTWILKALLLVHAAILAAMAYAQPTGRAVEPLWRSELTGFHTTAAERIGLIALLLIAAALRLHDLGEGLWYDEIQTLVRYGRLPVAQVFSTFDSQNQHMLYSLMARGSLAAFGENAWALRLPAVLLGVASLAALYFFAREIAGKLEAFLAVALLTFSYHHVWFSQNARGYTGLLLWTLLSSSIFLRLIGDREPRSWNLVFAYAATMALAVYTHVTALFVAVAHGLVWLALLVRSRQPGRIEVWRPMLGIVLAGTLSLLLYALVLPQFVETLTRPTMEGMATQWKDPLWLISETVRGLARGIPGGVFTVIAALLVAAAGTVSYLRRGWPVAAIMLLPGLLMAAMLLGLKHNLWPRFFFFAAGFAVLIAVRGAMSIAETLFRSRGRTLAGAALTLVIIGSATTVPTAWLPKQDFDGARDYILRHQAPGDAIVTIDMSAYAYSNYAAPGFTGVASESDLDRVERSHARTWIVYTFPTRLAAVQPAIWSRIQRDYKPAAEFRGTVGEGTIVVKVKT